MELSQELLLIKLIDSCKNLLKKLAIKYKSLDRRIFDLAVQLWIPVNFMEDSLSYCIPRQMRRVTQIIPEKKRAERELLKCSLAIIECKARMIRFRRNINAIKSDVARQIASYI